LTLWDPGFYDPRAMTTWVRIPSRIERIIDPILAEDREVTAHAQLSAKEPMYHARD
jgi:hypothetical protein